jgi:hypothetical protein
MQTDSRADIYALGIVMREMLAYINDALQPDNHKTLCKIIKKSTAFSPDDRYQNVKHFENALLRYQKKIKQKIRFGLYGLALTAVVFTVGFASARFFTAYRVAAENTASPPPVYHAVPVELPLQDANSRAAVLNPAYDNAAVAGEIIQEAINELLPRGGTVTVNGTRHNTLNENISLHIPAGVTVNWQAEYSVVTNGETEGILRLSGCGAFLVSAGFITLEANAGTLLVAEGTHVYLTGGLVSAVYTDGGNAVTAINGSVTVSDTANVFLRGSHGRIIVGENSNVVVTGGQLTAEVNELQLPPKPAAPPAP